MKNTNLNILTFLICFLFEFSFSQDSGDLTGRVVDSKTLFPLQGATILIEGESLGTISDENGYFKLEKIQFDSYNIVASYLGYKTEVIFNVIVKSAGSQDLLFKMDELSDQLDEVVLFKSPFKKKNETPLSIQSLSAVEIETYPGGNNDITKVAQSLPGISPSIGGFRNDFIIRGGAPNETVYYLDGMEIPNINHFSTQGSAGGPVGMLNVDFIREVTLSTSSFGAEFDNPLSGVLSFEQREGNREKFSGKFRIGASEAGITINTPIFKGEKKISKTSLMFSLRRSYLQYVFELVGLPIRPDYIDYQFKIDHRINNLNSISIMGIGSIDDFSVVAPEEFDAEQTAVIEQVPIIKQRSNTFGISWIKKFANGNGRVLTTLSSNELLNNFSRFQNNENESGLIYQNDAVEKETKIRSHVTKFIGDWKLGYGLNFQLSKYKNTTLGILEQFDYESKVNFYKYGFFGKISRSFFNDNLNLFFGIRTDKDNFLSKSNLIDNLSPRMGFSYSITKNDAWKLNGSIGWYNKLPPYTMIGFKNTSGVYVNKDVSYIRSKHTVVGIEFNRTPKSRITLEGFLKEYSNYPISIIDQISLANKGGGFEVYGNEPVIANGIGNSYGIEFLFQQKLNKNFYGIFAYTYFFSEFSDLNNDMIPSVWDSRNLSSFTGGYKLNRSWEVSMRYRYSGRTTYAPVNQIQSKISYARIVLDYSQIGQVYLDVFSQADIRIDKKWNFKKTSLNIYFEIQNILAQKIPRPPEYGLERQPDGILIEPINLKEIDTDRSDTPFPTIGLILDF